MIDIFVNNAHFQAGFTQGFLLVTVAGAAGYGFLAIIKSFLIAGG